MRRWALLLLLLPAIAVVVPIGAVVILLRVMLAWAEDHLVRSALYLIDTTKRLLLAPRDDGARQ